MVQGENTLRTSSFRFRASPGVLSKRSSFAPPRLEPLRMNEAPTTQKGILAVRLSLTLPVTVTELVLELTCVCVWIVSVVWLVLFL